MGPKEIEEALSWVKGGAEASFKASPVEWERFGAEEQLILKLLLENQELEIDRLSWLTNIPLSMLASLLLNLEFQGVIKSIPGKKYRMV